MVLCEVAHHVNYSALCIIHISEIFKSSSEKLHKHSKYDRGGQSGCFWDQSNFQF